MQGHLPPPIIFTSRPHTQWAHGWPTHPPPINHSLFGTQLPRPPLVCTSSHATLLAQVQAHRPPPPPPPATLHIQRTSRRAHKCWGSHGQATAEMTIEQRGQANKLVWDWCHGVVDHRSPTVVSPGFKPWRKRCAPTLRWACTGSERWSSHTRPITLYLTHHVLGHVLVQVTQLGVHLCRRSGDQSLLWTFMSSLQLGTVRIEHHLTGRVPHICVGRYHWELPKP
jgi:hypothetical protein